MAQIIIKEENEDSLAITQEDPMPQTFWSSFSSSVKKEMPLLVLYDLAEQMNQAENVENASHVREVVNSNDVEESEHLTDGEESECLSDGEESGHLSDTEESEHLSDKEESEHLTDREESEHVTNADELEHLTDAEEGECLTEAEEAEHLTDIDKSEHLSGAEEPEHLTDAAEAEHLASADDSNHAEDPTLYEELRDFYVQEPEHCSPIAEPKNLSHMEDQRDSKSYHNPKNMGNFTDNLSNIPEVETQKSKKGCKKNNLQYTPGHKNDILTSLTLGNIQKKDQKTADMGPVRKSQRKPKRNIIFFDSFVSYTSSMFEASHDAPVTQTNRLSTTTCQRKIESEKRAIVKENITALPIHPQQSINTKTKKGRPATCQFKTEPEKERTVKEKPTTLPNHNEKSSHTKAKKKSEKKIDDKIMAAADLKQNPKKRKMGKEKHEVIEKPEVIPNQDIRFEEEKKRVKLEDICIGNQKTKKKGKEGESLLGTPPIRDPKPKKRESKKEKLKVKLGMKKRPTKVKKEEEHRSTTTIIEQKTTIGEGDKVVNFVSKKPRRKNWFCEYCPESFSEIYYLKLHTMHHTNERPYTCDICNKGFRMRWRVKLHRLTHSKEKPFQCKYCDLRCNRRDNMIGHMRRVHPEFSKSADVSLFCKTYMKTEKT